MSLRNITRGGVRALPRLPTGPIPSAVVGGVIVFDDFTTDTDIANITSPGRVTPVGGKTWERKSIYSARWSPRVLAANDFMDTLTPTSATLGTCWLLDCGITDVKLKVNHTARFGANGQSDQMVLIAGHPSTPTPAVVSTSGVGCGWHSTTGSPFSYPILMIGPVVVDSDSGGNFVDNTNQDFELRYQQGVELSATIGVTELSAPTPPNNPGTWVGGSMKQFNSGITYYWCGKWDNFSVEAYP